MTLHVGLLCPSALRQWFPCLCSGQGFGHWDFGFVLDLVVFGFGIC